MSLTILMGTRHIPPPPEPQPGDPLGGGFYVGKIVVGANTYRIVVAPKSAESALLWKVNTTDSPGTSSLNDGWSNTVSMNDANHPAAQYCRSYTGGGFSDWYMGARDEIELLYRYLKPTTQANSTGARAVAIGAGNIGQNDNSSPIGLAYVSNVPGQTPALAFRTGGAQVLESASGILTSTQTISGGTARCAYQEMGSGFQDSIPKNQAGGVVRPIRRILITP